MAYPTPPRSQGIYGVDQRVSQGRMMELDLGEGLAFEALDQRRVRVASVQAGQ